MEFKEALEKKISQKMDVIAILLQNQLKENCPVDSGRLKNSIKTKALGNKIVVWMAFYGEYVEFGTLPHEIVPVKGEALKWKDGKKVIFAKRVMHPGTRPNPFIRRTVHNDLKKIIKVAIQ